MDNDSDAIQSRRNASPPTNLPEDFTGNDNSDNDELRLKQSNSYQLSDAVRSKNRRQSNNGNDDKSISHFVSATSVSEGGDSQHMARVYSRLGDGNVGFQSRQPPRHHRMGNISERDNFGTNDGGSFKNNATSSYFKPAGIAKVDADDVNYMQQQHVIAQRNQFDVQFGSSDTRQSERQRFLNFASLSPSTDSVSGWTPSSPSLRRTFYPQSLMPEDQAKQERRKQQGQKLSRLHQTYLQPHHGSLDSYQEYQRQSQESATNSLEYNAIAPTQEIQSTIRVMEYSQRQRIRQRRQQSGHNHSILQGSPITPTDQWYVNNNRAHSPSAEIDAIQLAQPQFIQQNGASSSGDRKQSPAIDSSSHREKRSQSFDTAISMNTLDHEVGDIVDYSQYPNRTCDVEEQQASNYHGKRKNVVGHSRSHSTSETISMGIRRNKMKRATAIHSKVKSYGQQPTTTSWSNLTTSFESSNGSNSNARKWSPISSRDVAGSTSHRNIERKQRRQNRSSNTQTVDASSAQESQDGFKGIYKVENVNYSSDDSKSISDYEKENGSLFKQRIHDSIGIHGPSVKRKNKTISPFANIGKSSAEKAARSTFLPTSYGSDDKMYSTFVCPRCNTRQREFFTVENAAGRLEGPGSYLALYFAVYVICSLFIFGLEEGWKPLDCIYFAVITLTTAGLGDFVPTSWVNKIICSIFIYFGVACIGLLLGSYIASMLDHRAIIDRKGKQIDACPNCARIKTMNEATIARNKAVLDAKVKYLSERGEKRYKSSFNEYDITTPCRDEEYRKSHRDIWDNRHGSASPAVSNSSSVNSRLLGSPVTRQILGRQKHTRHASIDVSTSKIFSGVLPTNYGTSMVKNVGDEMISHRASTHLGRHGQVNQQSNPNKLRTIASSENLYEDTSSESDAESTALSSSTLSSTEAIWDGTKSQLNAAKYVFLTLRLALFNSMVIIAVGCVGFHLIEGFSLVDSWYFTTVLLTTVGYGDIVPVTDAGKLFATIYILVAGTLLLNNMSSISMIPLELRRRRIERAVLTQFGDHLDDAALRELATGPLIQRLRLTTNRTDGLDECTREMFSLAMLVRLGKVTEHDIRGTFSCFRHLDVNNEGVLNSKSIIAGMIAKQRQSNAFNANLRPPPPPPPPPDVTADDEVDQNLEGAWFGRMGSLHVKTTENSYIFHPVNMPNQTATQTTGEQLGLPLNFN